MWLAAALAVSGDSPREEVEDLGRGGRVVLEEPAGTSAYLPSQVYLNPCSFWGRLGKFLTCVDVASASAVRKAEPSLLVDTAQDAGFGKRAGRRVPGFGGEACCVFVHVFMYVCVQHAHKLGAHQGQRGVWFSRLGAAWRWRQNYTAVRQEMLSATESPACDHSWWEAESGEGKLEAPRFLGDRSFTT